MNIFSNVITDHDLSEFENEHLSNKKRLYIFTDLYLNELLYLKLFIKC